MEDHGEGAGKHTKDLTPKRRLKGDAPVTTPDMLANGGHFPHPLAMVLFLKK